MVAFLDILLRAGRSGVELALFVLLPIMVVMLSCMRVLEAKGMLDRLIHTLAPVLRPIGLTGLGIFAALQVNFVSFAAPVATLAMMEQRGASDRHLAATLAMVMAMAQANVLLPMSTMGVHLGIALMLSLVGGLIAAAFCFHVAGRHLSCAEAEVDETLHHPVAENAKGVLDVINRAGAEAFKITIGSIPMLVLALVAVAALRTSGAIDLLTTLISPILVPLGISPSLVLPTLTKYLGGGTAMMGVMDEMLKAGTASVHTLNASVGFLLHPLDIPGIAILISAGKRVAAIWKTALVGAIVGIGVRTVGHILLS